MERETFCAKCKRSVFWDSDLLAHYCFKDGYLSEDEVIFKEPQCDLTDAGYKLVVGERARPALRLTAKALAEIGESPNSHVDQQTA